MNGQTRQNVTPAGACLRGLWRAGLVLACLAWVGCNSPYDKSEEKSNTLYRTFGGEPKTLDPGLVYGGDAAELLYLTTETLFQYHLLKQPYQLEPLTAVAVPEAETRKITRGGKEIEVTTYTIRLKPGILYDPHPCFVRANRHLSESDVRGVWKVSDLRKTATRPLRMGDYAHAIRRLADSRVMCPILTTLKQNILGMEEYAEKLDEALEAKRKQREIDGGPGYTRVKDERLRPIQLDYNAFGLDGVEVVDDQTLRIHLKQPYPQMLYWMALPFFTPVPPEATEFFSQPVLSARMITFEQNIVGTGPFRIAEYDPTNQLVLERNVNYRKGATPQTNPEAFYPTLTPAERDALPPEHLAALKAEHMFDDAGRRLPMLDRIVFRMEKEWIPRWNKFLQGYYDTSDISSDLFDQAITLTSQGDPNLSDDMVARGIRLQTAPSPGIHYYAFNMSDPVVGGYTDKARKLRQAISIAFDMEEYIAIFSNSRAAVAHSPIPPGIFGFEGGKQGMNEKVFRWDAREGKPVRRGIDEARKLLAEAGYPDGYDADGKQLTIRFDNYWAATSYRPRVKFVINQFAKLGIALRNNSIRDTKYWEMIKAGNFQFIALGWGADYPDVENFYFLLYGGNSTKKERRENCSNYQNPEFNRLFEQSKAMPNGPARQKLIHRMNDIVQNDAPWLFGQHGMRYSLVHEWCHNSHPNAMARNAAKYMRIDADLRARCREKWNHPVLAPILIFLAVLAALAVPAFWLAARHMRET